MNHLKNIIKSAFREIQQSPWQLLLLYAFVYFCWGMAMDQFGQWARIAQFKYWWQVLTVYVLYLAPISVACHRSSWTTQYLVGVLALAPIELVGYRIGSSIAHDGNILDAILGPRNFTLAMTIFFGTYIPIGNAAVRSLAKRIGILETGTSIPEGDEAV